LNNTLSQNSIDIIKNSAELITANDIAITQRMYELLFIKYPNLQELFKNAPDNQYMKLAEALSAYAINIEKLDVLKPALAVIARVHVKVNIKPSHYPVIGMVLMQAIEDILGERASIELIDAWREAYKHISFVLIEIEKEMYALQKT